MNLDNSTIKDLATGLKEQLRNGLPEAATQTSCLELLARAAGLKNWQTYQAQLFRTWTYRRHEAYLPNRADIVKSLSTRKAVIDDMNQHSDTEQPGGQWGDSLQQMFWQLNNARQGDLRVEFELTAALSAGTSQPLSELEQRVAGSRRNVEDFLEDYGRQPMSVTNAERYQHLYMDWRLATLSLAFNRLMQRPRKGQLVQLLRNHVDVFGFTALHMAGRFKLDQSLPGYDAIESMTHDLRNENSNLRYGAKALLLEYLTGSEVAFARLNDTLSLPQWKLDVSEGYELLDQLFPEVALWHAWVELKPLLAPEADAYYRQRQREIRDVGSKD